MVIAIGSGRDDAGGGMVTASSTQAMAMVSAVAGSHRRRVRVGVGCRHCHLVDNAGGGHCRRR